MRARSALVLAVIALLSSLFTVASPVAHAGDLVLAQEDSQEGDEGATDTEEGSGSSEAEVGADEGQTEEGTTEAEAGPPWTYQMSKIVLALLVVMALAIGLLYWRLVVQRQRRGI